MAEDARQLGVATWGALLRAHATVVRILEREVEREAGVPLSWYDVLLELNEAPARRLRMHALAEKVVLSRTRVSRVVDEMARAGLVEKRADPRDGRATLATLTADGRKALRKAAPVYLRGIEEHFARHLDERQLAEIADGLRAVLEAHGIRG